MKWKTLAGLALALAAWSRLSEDLSSGTLIPETDPVSPDIKPDCGPGKKPQRYFDTNKDRWTWRCVLESA